MRHNRVVCWSIKIPNQRGQKKKQVHQCASIVGKSVLSFNPGTGCMIRRISCHRKKIRSKRKWKGKKHKGKRNPREARIAVCLCAVGQRSKGMPLEGGVGIEREFPISGSLTRSARMRPASNKKPNAVRFFDIFFHPI